MKIDPRDIVDIGRNDQLCIRGWEFIGCFIRVGLEGL